MTTENREVRIYRHLRSGDWCPYQGVIHMADDARADKHDLSITLSHALQAGLVDGDEIEITVRTTGRRLTTRWELARPHEYGPTETPESRGCPRCRAALAPEASGT